MEALVEGQHENVAPPTEGFMPSLEAEHITFGPGFVIGAEAKQDITMSQAGAFGIEAGRDIQIEFGGAMALVAGKDMRVTNGGASYMVVGGNAEVTNGGACMMVANQVTGRKSFFGILLSQQTTLEEGSQVLLDTKRAAALGAALGVFFALTAWLLGKK